MTSNLLPKVRRGEIWTVAAPGDYTSKPRPAVIIQDDVFAETSSVTVAVFTTDPTPAPLFRIAIEPLATSGLEQESWLMIDKITTIPKSKLGRRVGALAKSDVKRINSAIALFLGLAARPNKTSSAERD